MTFDQLQTVIRDFQSNQTLTEKKRLFHDAIDSSCDSQEEYEKPKKKTKSTTTAAAKQKLTIKPLVA